MSLIFAIFHCLLSLKGHTFYLHLLILHRYTYFFQDMCFYRNICNPFLDVTQIKFTDRSNEIGRKWKRRRNFSFVLSLSLNKSLYSPYVAFSFVESVKEKSQGSVLFFLFTLNFYNFIFVLSIFFFVTGWWHYKRIKASRPWYNQILYMYKNGKLLIKVWIWLIIFPLFSCITFKNKAK